MQAVIPPTLHSARSQLCSLCGSRLLAGTRASRFATGSSMPRSSNRSITSLRIPRWASTSSSSSLFSTAATAGPSKRASRLSPSESAAEWRRSCLRRSYATIVELPTASEDELPEPVLNQGQESPSTTLNVTAAAEKVRLHAITLSQRGLIGLLLATCKDTRARKGSKSGLADPRGERRVPRVQHQAARSRHRQRPARR